MLGRVRDAEPAAEVELGQHDVVVALHLGVQAEHASGRHLEPGGVEDLRPDVRVQPEQPQRRVREHARDRLGCNALREREPELLVLVRGGDVGVRVRLDADRHPQQHGRDRAALRGDRRPAGRSRSASRPRPGRCRRRPRAPARRGTCCCRAARSRPGRAPPAGRRRARCRCRCRAAGPPAPPSAPPRCTGTPCRRSRRRRRRTGPRTPRRRPSRNPARGNGSRPRPARRPACRGRGRSPGRRARRRSATRPVPARPPTTTGAAPAGSGRSGRRARAALRTPRRAGHRPRAPSCHIRSGAETPHSVSPFASTWRVASASQSRVRWVSVTGSSPCGVTRHASYHLWNSEASCSR